VQLKKIGIVGGVSWISTVEYYKTICQLSHEHQHERAPEGPPAVPEIIIESLNINKSFNLRGQPGDDASWRQYEAYFRGALKRLEASGVDFAIIASNTPHNRYDSITEGIGVPVLNIFEEVAKECARNSVRNTLILGTAPTMSSPVFPVVLEKHGIFGTVPQADHDQAMIISLIDKLQAGENHAAAELIQGLAMTYLSMNSDERQSVCLSCTELPLAFPEFVDAPTFEMNGVLYLNTTIVHAKAAFDYAVSTNVA
jgi:aspartate racemase